MSENKEENFNPTLRMGIMVMPMIMVDFTVEGQKEGEPNPVIEAVRDAVTEMMDAANQKAYMIAELFCKHNGLTLEVMPPEEVVDKARIVLNDEHISTKLMNEEEFYGNWNKVVNGEEG